MSAGVRRFYDKVGVRCAAAVAECVGRQPGACSWLVTLDGRDLRTPAKKLLELPSEGLAWAIATEWEAQPQQRIQPALMPLMTLATTTIDQFPAIRDTMTQSMLRSLESDSACLRSDVPALAAKEDKHFEPLHAWLAAELDLRLTVTDSLVLTHPEEALPRATALLDSADDWQLAALDMMTSSTKSLVISLALAHGRISASEACAASRVAEQHQIDEWGEVEMGHDLDAADCAVRLSASSAFLQLLDRPWRDPGA